MRHLLGRAALIRCLLLILKNATSSTEGFRHSANNVKDGFTCIYVLSLLRSGAVGQGGNELKCPQASVCAEWCSAEVWDAVLSSAGTATTHK